MNHPSETDPGSDQGTEDGADRRPLIDVSGALHMAGHEAELLGFEGVPDTAPVVPAAIPTTMTTPTATPATASAPTSPPGASATTTELAVGSSRGL